MPDRLKMLNVAAFSQCGCLFVPGPTGRTGLAQEAAISNSSRNLIVFTF